MVWHSSPRLFFYYNGRWTARPQYTRMNKFYALMMALIVSIVQFEATGGFLSGAHGKLMAGQLVRNLTQKRDELINAPYYPNKFEDVDKLTFEISKARTDYIRLLINFQTKEGMSELSNDVPCYELTIPGKSWSYTSGYNKGVGNRIFQDGIQDLCSGSYSKGLAKILKSAVVIPDSYYWVAIMVEIGLGCDVDHNTAKTIYEYGANYYGSALCKLSINRIHTTGYLTQDYKDQWLTFVKETNKTNLSEHNNATVNLGYPFNMGSIMINNSSPITNNPCTSCGGSGICTSCGGSGYYIVDTGTYTGHDTQAIHDCPSCHGSRRCSICFGSGRR